MSGSAKTRASQSFEPLGRLLRRVGPVAGATLLLLITVPSVFGLPHPIGGYPAPVLPAAAPHPNPVLSGAALQRSPFLSSPGTGLAAHPGAQILQPMPATQTVYFTVGFQMRNPTLLEQILQNQATPGNPQDRQWLSLDQERQLFGPDPAVYQDTVNYFTSLGLRVQFAGPISISFYGTAAQVNAAFKTEMVEVQTTTGTAPIPMNRLPLSLPNPIATAISTVNGLDQSTVAHVEHFVDPASLSEISPTQSTALLHTFLNWVNESKGFNFTNHAFLWWKYYSTTFHKVRWWQLLTPASLSWAYQALPLINQGIGGNSTGTPIRIAIVMAGGINPSDVRNYSRLAWNDPNQLYHRLQPLPVDGAFGLNGTLTYTDGVSGEMALDMEFSSTMAPGAIIMPTYGPCLCTNVLDDDYALLDSLPAARFPNVISNSWGGDEDGWPNLYGVNWNNAITMHNYFMLLDARGATILASSGDGGGFDSTTGMLAASFPAGDPYVLSINGIRTQLGDPSGTIFPSNPNLGWTNITDGLTGATWQFGIQTPAKVVNQSFWYNPFSNLSIYKPPESSGGFGTSYWFNQSWWQHGVGIPNLERSLGSGVSAEADFNQSIFFDGNWQFRYGGTSFGCPTTAGEFALIDDYLAKHGLNPYLGNGNVPVWQVGNAFVNGNLTLVPFSDVKNGTSFWGNIGVQNGWEWPGGQKFPFSGKNTTYGDSLPGYDFPTGWGSINVYNFAADLATLDNLPGQFQTLNSAGNQYSPSTWANLALNQTYNIHVNMTGVPSASTPVVTVAFWNSAGTSSRFQPMLNQVSGIFSINTSNSPFNSPGYVVFELGNSTVPTLGFAYSWIAPTLPKGGILNVTVVAPSSKSVLGGLAHYNAVIGGSPPIIVDPNWNFGGLEDLYQNSFTVRVTLNGQPVYNARVTASAPISSLAWQGSTGQLLSTYGIGNEVATPIMSQSFTNLTGDALVDTWNVVRPVNYSIAATYSTLSASTFYEVDPGPNIATTDAYGAQYSEFNLLSFFYKYDMHHGVNPSPAWLNGFVPNSYNQSAFYTMGYAWQGEEFPVLINDYAGRPMNGVNVWLGNFDLGARTVFTHFEATGGVKGVTNTSGTANVTGVTGPQSGYAAVQIPDNQSLDGFFGLGNFSFPSGSAFIAASMPGQVNRTFQYTEPCARSIFSPNLPYHCMFNNSYERNYTTLPLLILPNPISAWTQTTAGVHRDFFESGANISWGVDVSLPLSDPFLVGVPPGAAWTPAYEYVKHVNVSVDNQTAGTLDPANPGYQAYKNTGNLTGVYGPGIHTLLVKVVDGVGHVFTFSHTFVVGSIVVSNLGVQNVYTVLPYNLEWMLNIPFQEVNNKTFNQSLEIRYVTGGCGGIVSCPQVVNYTIKIHKEQIFYNQSINRTMLNLQNFYSGSGDLPPGQYQIILWLRANHSGSISTVVTTYLVFDPVQGTITGPTANEVVPVGNVTLSYSYTGQYLSNAILSVYPAVSASPLVASTTAVFTAGAFQPGIGIRAGAATWTAVTGGPYNVVLLMATPYGNFTASEWMNVSTSSGIVYLNSSPGPAPVGGLPPLPTALALVLAAGIVGVLLGGLFAPGLASGRRGAPEGAKSAPPRPWEEAGAGSGGFECAKCHEKFTTEFARDQHVKIVHVTDP